MKRYLLHCAGAMATAVVVAAWGGAPSSAVEAPVRWTTIQAR